MILCGRPPGLRVEDRISSKDFGHQGQGSTTEWKEPRGEPVKDAKKEEEASERDLSIPQAYGRLLHAVLARGKLRERRLQRKARTEEEEGTDIEGLCQEDLAGLPQSPSRPPPQWRGPIVPRLRPVESRVQQRDHQPKNKCAKKKEHQLVFKEFAAERKAAKKKKKEVKIRSGAKEVLAWVSGTEDEKLLRWASEGEENLKVRNSSGIMGPDSGNRQSNPDGV